MKGLVIDEPWIGKILRGDKTWEMRKTACHQRGRVALIRKGSGLVVGIADVVDSLPPIATREAYGAAETFHGIPTDRQERAFEDGWTTPWVLADAMPLSPPVKYRHPSGAVIWVALDDEVSSAIARQANKERQASAVSDADNREPFADREDASPAPTGRRAPSSTSPASPVDSDDARRIFLTGGNLRNNHIYLPLDFFPADAIGGSSKATEARRKITVTFDLGATIETDIDGTKRILRTRGAVGDFLARAGAEPGAVVVISRPRA